jgi:hypothetical protein
VATTRSAAISDNATQYGGLGDSHASAAIRNAKWAMQQQMHNQQQQKQQQFRDEPDSLVRDIWCSL